MATHAFLPTATWSGKLFDGQWAAGAGTQHVVEPATGERLGEMLPPMVTAVKLCWTHVEICDETLLPPLWPPPPKPPPARK